MFTINSQDTTGRRRSDAATDETIAMSPAMPELPSDRTQRVSIPSASASPRQVPAQRTSSRQAQPQRPATRQTTAQRPASQQAAPQNPRRRTPASQKKKTGKIILLCSIAAVLVVSIVLLLLTLFTPPKDDGLILDNVFAAGVDLGGMTLEEAKTALRKATSDTYPKVDMVITILDETITLSPKDTGVLLNVDAAAQAAYNFGRTGSASDRQKDKNLAQTSSYQVPIIEHLNLNTKYLEQTLDAIGKKYSTTLIQPSATISGTAPSLEQDAYDTTIAYQTLSVFVGSAEYSLNVKALHQQILDAYNINLFQVTANCSIVSPNAVDVDALFQQYCTTPVDADIDENYQITPEIYGYGFDLEAVRSQIASAEYGTTLEVPLHFIKPNVTEEDLSKNLFQDILGQTTTTVSGSTDWLINVIQACEVLDGTLIKPGAQFSFNGLLGQPSSAKGYVKVPTYVGKELLEVMGGGISQVSSTLYCSAIQADLTIVERKSHTFAPNFITPGLDADVQYGKVNLVFNNSTDYPIRIQASVEDGKLSIALIGTNTRNYSVSIFTENIREYTPVTLIQGLAPDNPEGYISGDILVPGIAGCDVITYKTYQYSDGSSDSQEFEIAQTHYEKRNEVIVQIIIPEPDPTEPTEPEDPTIPEDPTDPLDPPDDPSVPEVPTDPLLPIVPPIF